MKEDRSIIYVGLVLLVCLCVIAIAIVATKRIEADARVEVARIIAEAHVE